MAKFNFKYGSPTGTNAQALATGNYSGSDFSAGDFILTKSGDFYIANPDTTDTQKKIFHINEVTQSSLNSAKQELTSKIEQHQDKLLGSNTYAPGKLSQTSITDSEGNEVVSTILDPTYKLRDFDDILAYLCNASGFSAQNARDGNLYLGSWMYDAITSTYWIVVGFNMYQGLYRGVESSGGYAQISAPNVTLLRVNPTNNYAWFTTDGGPGTISHASYGHSKIRKEAASIGIAVEEELNGYNYYNGSTTAEQSIRLSQCRISNTYIVSPFNSTSTYTPYQYTATDLANVPNLTQACGKNTQVFSGMSDEVFPLFKAESKYRRWISAQCNGFWLRDTAMNTDSAPEYASYINELGVASTKSVSTTNCLVTYHVISLSGEVTTVDGVETYRAFPWVADGDINLENKILSMNMQSDTWESTFGSYNHA